MAIKDYQDKLVEITDEIEKHGYGEVKIIFEEIKNFKIKVVIIAGRSWVFFISKKVQFDYDDVL